MGDTEYDSTEENDSEPDNESLINTKWLEENNPESDNESLTDAAVWKEDNDPAEEHKGQN